MNDDMTTSIEPTPATPDDGHKYIPSGSRRLGSYHICMRCGRPPQEHMSRERDD